MRIVQINLTYKIGSTGHIMDDLNKVILDSGNESLMVCGYSHNTRENNLYVMQTLSPIWDMRKDILISRLTGRMGYNSRRETKKMVKWLEKHQPDIVHLHNIHGNYIHLGILFNYLKKANIPIVWTLHDCWSFTGRCSYFEAQRCNKWKTGCNSCTQREIYPITYFFDFSKSMWKDKKKLFTTLSNVQLITPSKWLKNYVDESFLNKYNCGVIHNGINLDVFKPIAEKSHYLKGDTRKVILGVASSWTERKGLYDFFKLDEMIDHNKYRIVLVGLNERQMKLIPESIMGIKRTNDINELVELYSSADVFVNPTYQDNYPTVNMEATACGTPVVTYRTGGSPESVPVEVGLVVEKGNINQLYNSIMQLLSEDNNFEKCNVYAREWFDKNKKYEEYLDCYNQMIDKMEE